MGKEVMILTGAGQIGMAIARRMGYGKKIILGDKKPENAQAMAKIMNEAGFDVLPMEMDLSSGYPEFNSRGTEGRRDYNAGQCCWCIAEPGTGGSNSES